MAEPLTVPNARSRARTLVPLLLILLLGMGSLAGLLVYASAAINKSIRDGMQERVANSLRHEARVLSELAMDYSYWDVGYDSLIRQPDATWADDNIGSYLYDYLKVDLCVAVNASDIPTFTFFHGQPASLNLEQMTDAGLGTIVAREQAAQSPGEGDSGFVEFGGSVYLFGINSFTIDYINEEEDGSYIALAKRLNQSFLNRLSNQYQVPGLTLVDRARTNPALSLDVLDTNGHRIATLAWSDPGLSYPLGNGLIWLIAGIAITMCLLALYVVRTEIAHHEQHVMLLSNMAYRDWLTGADNRRAFFEKGQQELDRARRHANPTSLLLLDIDHFKVINDSRGHAAGDAVLVLLTRCLLKQLRQYDMVARVGGEEFAVILPQVELESAALVAERLRQAVSDMHNTSKDVHWPVTVSIGVAEWQAEESLDDMMERADKALYAAKTGGRDRCITSPVKASVSQIGSDRQGDTISEKSA